jgi:hypothetical protein
MNKTLTDAQLHDVLKPCAIAYNEQQNELNTRAHQAEKTLDMMIEVMLPVAEYLTSLKVPATARREKDGVVLEVGESPNTSGQLSVKRTADFCLVVGRRLVTGAGDIGTHESPPRAPNDFGSPPDWRAEIAASLGWILASPPRGVTDRDDEDSERGED